MTKRHTQLVSFDEHGIYEINDQALIALVSPQGIAGDAFLETVGGFLDGACGDENGYCNSDTYCGNRPCGNNLCFEEGVNVVCNPNINTVC
jgi:hypothetical protein